MAKAGTTGPNLASAKRAIEKLMDDRCVIRFDVEGAGDDTFDEDTLLEAPPAFDSLYVYQGRCMVRTQGATETNLAGRVVPSRSYHVKIPVDAPVIPRGAVVTITAARRDPQLVGQRFTVQDAKTSTFAVSRELTCERLLTPPVADVITPSGSVDVVDPNEDLAYTPTTLTVTTTGDPETFDTLAFVDDPVGYGPLPWTFEWENLPEYPPPGVSYDVSFAVFNSGSRNFVVQATPGNDVPNAVYADDAIPGYSTVQQLGEFVSAHYAFPGIPFPVLSLNDVWQWVALEEGGFEAYRYHANGVTVIEG